MTNTKLELWDFVAIGAYFAAVIGAGLYAMCRTNRGTVSGYFLAGRFMSWLPVGASLFASNIGSEHFIGLAGSGAAAGIAVGAFELNAAFLLQLLGWLFLPVYIASGVCTLPEYMTKRFGGKRIRIYLASLSLMLYIVTKVSVNLYSGALFIQQALQWDLYVSVILLLLATAITTVTGGLTAVIYTDTLQAGVMIIGALVLMILSLIRVGGYSELHHRYMMSISNSSLLNPNDTCGYPRPDSWTMLRDPIDSDLPWPGFLLGQTPASIWYWCADQMMVQRTLAARSLSHAQGGTVFAGYLKLFPVFFIVIPGMISRVLFTDEVACSDPDICDAVCGNRMGCSNIAYPKLVLEVMPVGLKGVMLSVMLAALMSDLTSIFNSASTLFTMDIYRYIRRAAPTRELMIVGRVFVCVMVVIGIIWIPVIQGMQGGQLYIYIQAIAAYLAPPIACVYLIAVLWKRGNEKGAFYGLMIPMLIGVVRMVLGFIYRDPSCGEEDTRPYIIAHVHYMYFAVFLFAITGVVMICVSLCTEPPTSQQLCRTTYWTRFDKIEETALHQQSNGHDSQHDVKHGSERNGVADVHAHIDGRGDEGGAHRRVGHKGSDVVEHEPDDVMVEVGDDDESEENAGVIMDDSLKEGALLIDEGRMFRHTSGRRSRHGSENQALDVRVTSDTNEIDGIRYLPHQSGEGHKMDQSAHNVKQSEHKVTHSGAGEKSTQAGGGDCRKIKVEEDQLLNGLLLEGADVKRDSTGQSDDTRSCSSVQPLLDALCRAGEWFCGINTSREELQMDEAHYSKITSLHQTKSAQIYLFIALLVLIALDILLVVFFCTGSDFGLVADPPPISSFPNATMWS